MENEDVRGMTIEQLVIAYANATYEWKENADRMLAAIEGVPQPDTSFERHEKHMAGMRRMDAILAEARRRDESITPATESEE